MVREPADARPYHALRYEIGAAPGGGRVTLVSMAPGEADRLGAAFAAIDPWAAYAIPPARLAAFFTSSEEGCSRRAIRIDGRLAGAVVVRAPWLHGPYLQFLGLLPGEEGAGVGRLVLDWMQAEAPPGTRNLWLCVSAINRRALAFYERHGFRQVAALEALAADHMDELLMRKRLAPA